MVPGFWCGQLERYCTITERRNAGRRGQGGSKGNNEFLFEFELFIGHPRGVGQQN